MAADNLPINKKKLWSKPEIYLLDSGNVNGGVGTNFREGVATGGGDYSIKTNGGLPFGVVTPLDWSNYHS